MNGFFLDNCFKMFNILYIFIQGYYLDVTRQILLYCIICVMHGIHTYMWPREDDYMSQGDEYAGHGIKRI